MFGIKWMCVCCNWSNYEGSRWLRYLNLPHSDLTLMWLELSDSLLWLNTSKVKAQFVSLKVFKWLNTVVKRWILPVIGERSRQALRACVSDLELAFRSRPSIILRTYLVCSWHTDKRNLLPLKTTKGSSSPALNTKEFGSKLTRLTKLSKRIDFDSHKDILYYASSSLFDFHLTFDFQPSGNDRFVHHAVLIFLLHGYFSGDKNTG